MPEYLAPGVYVEEVNTGPRPIEGVSTSTAGFVGETERGTTKPTLVTSWADFYRTFGGYIDRPPMNAVNWRLPYAVRGFFDNGGQRLYIARVVGPNPQLARLSLPGTGNPAPVTTVEANGPGLWGTRVRVRVDKASVVDTLPLPPPGQQQTSPAANWFRIRVLYYREFPTPFVDPTDRAKLSDPNRRDPDAFEDFDNLSADPTAANYAMSLINGSSRLIRITACPGKPNDVLFPGGALTVANPNTPDPATNLVTVTGAAANPEDRTGLEGLLTIRDISLMAVPDDVVSPTFADALLDRCEAAKDRFAILNDPTDSSDLQAVGRHRDSTYGALYYPRLRVIAPHSPLGHVIVPSCGHMAGIYARSDIERGVHKAPANEVVRGILSRDLNGGIRPLDKTLTKQEHDILNPKGVNVIRDFRSDGRDIRIWGARTMSSDAMWKYVNVRRLFIFIEQSIDRGTQWAVFEPNSEPTWIAVRASITNFLRTVWRNGALMGATQDEAFFVKCDRTTMTQDDFDNGRLICLIGVAPVKPAEFVIFRISQKTLEAEQ
jgi:phage tail sheath protein FI